MLIVDDDEPTLKIVNDVLTYRGYRVLLARGGAEAIELALSEKPDVILLDVQLPDISGLSVARRLKSDPRTCTTPIAAMTALVMPDDKSKLLGSGCDLHIAKPLRLNELIQVVEVLCGQQSRP